MEFAIRTRYWDFRILRRTSQKKLCSSENLFLNGDPWAVVMSVMRSTMTVLMDLLFKLYMTERIFSLDLYSLSSMHTKTSSIHKFDYKLISFFWSMSQKKVLDSFLRTYKTTLPLMVSLESCSYETLFYLKHLKDLVSNADHLWNGSIRFLYYRILVLKWNDTKRLCVCYFSVSLRITT